MTSAASPTRLSHRALGIALGLVGLAGMAFSAFGLAMTWFQELMSRSFRAPEEFEAGQRAIWTVWRTHLPIWIVGGIGLVWCGVRLYRLRPASIGLARLACVLALVAMTAYMVDAWVRAIPAMEPLFSRHPMMPGGSFREFAAASAMGSLVMVAAPFAVLLWGLRARRTSGPG